MSEVFRLAKKTILVFKTRGVKKVLEEFKNYLNKELVSKYRNDKNIKDFLFVSGCYIKAPMRYRCYFQKEQLEKNGLTGDIILYENINDDLVNRYDVFILYRVPITKEIRRFIKLAKLQNKMVIYDMDDLVFDDKLPKEKREVKEMKEETRKLYFNGIKRMRETMKMCDFGIVSTLTIKKEMERYIPKVIVNRNSVADSLIEVSEKVYDKFRNKTGKNKITMGYFSGSRTHDDDFKMIESPLITVLEKYKNVHLMIVGPLKISGKFNKFTERVERKGLVDWRKLPKLIMRIDINLAPLHPSIFNNGKSELKFTETALLLKPTIASDTNPFLYAIKEGITGYIARNKNEWTKKMSLLIENRDIRKKIGRSAYKDVLIRYNTKKFGKKLVDFINKRRNKKIVYIAPSTNMSGGVMVVCQHLKRLQQRGFNVSLISQDNKNKIIWLDDFGVPVIPYNSFRDSKLKLLDVAVATFWATLEGVKESKAKKKYYLVQGKESEFYKEGSFKYRLALETYMEDKINYLTISRWCQKWLKDEFGKSARYIPNAIDIKTFHRADPVMPKNSKTRILIEGNPDDGYKNVDESFKIANKLDKNKYEIWFISYGGKPKKWYRYEKFFQKILYREMKKYYSSCNILLKTSKLESFSYPPLEMMACEGVSVVAENEGNKEYIKNEYNALTYKLGDINNAVKQVERLVSDKDLRNRLIENGIKTAKERNWRKSIDILEEIFLD